MANIYVRSTDGDNADNGSTWALAKATLAGAAAIDAAGDTIFLSASHTENSSPGAISVALAGTLAAPVRVLSVDDSAEPPTTIAAGATVQTTGAYAITVTGSCYIEGVSFVAGLTSTSSVPDILLESQGHLQHYKDCTFYAAANSSTALLTIGGENGSTPGRVVMDDPVFRFGNAAQVVKCTGDVHIRGGSLHASTAAIATFVQPTYTTNIRGGATLIEGFDLTGAATAVDLVSLSGSYAYAHVVFNNCRLPAGWNGDLFSATPTVPVRCEMYNCDAGDTNYRLWVEDFMGSVKSEPTIVMSGEAWAWKLATNANASYPSGALESPPIAAWNTTVGSAVAVSVEIVHDSQGAGTAGAFQDDEIWIEVQYLGTSGVPRSTFVRDSKATVLSTAADQTSSAQSWTTTGLTTPVTQRLSVSITPQEAGYIQARVFLAKASKTVYVNPDLAIA